MKPIIIIPPDTMSEADIKELRDNGLCVVTAKDPATVKFLDPIPSAAERTKVEDAAIQLSRRILNRDFWANNDTRKTMAENYVDILIRGTALDPKPSQAEVERQTFDSTKLDELRKLAREEAKAERLAAKAKENERKKP